MSGAATGTTYTASSGTTQGEHGLAVVAGTAYEPILSNTTSVLRSSGGGAPSVRNIVA